MTLSQSRLLPHNFSVSVTLPDDILGFYRPLYLASFCIHRFPQNCLWSPEIRHWWFSPLFQNVIFDLFLLVSTFLTPTLWFLVLSPLKSWHLCFKPLAASYLIRKWPSSRVGIFLITSSFLCLCQTLPWAFVGLYTLLLSVFTHFFDSACMAHISDIVIFRRFLKRLLSFIAPSFVEYSYSFSHWDLWLVSLCFSSHTSHPPPLSRRRAIPPHCS